MVRAERTTRPGRICAIYWMTADLNKNERKQVSQTKWMVSREAESLNENGRVYSEQNMICAEVSSLIKFSTNWN